ncbi:MAG: mechanosensitive ion channel family protein [Clostridiales bacterium]|nr:mechanosensitive ion channel family protein [Clostridiales bacterium]
MQKKKGKQLIGLLVCLAIGGAALGFGISDGVFKSAGSVFGNIQIDKASILTLIVMIFGVLAVEKLLVLLLGLFKGSNHRAATVITITQSLLRYAAAIVILCWGLSIIGVNVSTILASVGIVALIVGFGAESLIEDVITGFFMLFENQYNVGDIVEVSGFRGTVSDIGIRTTSLTDPGGNVKIINNSNMKDILNRSDHASRALSDIQIPYETDLPAFEEKLPDMMDSIFEAHKDVMHSAPVYLGVQELGESGVTLRFVVEVDECDIYKVQRILNRELLVSFRQAGVEVPFPQLDLHQK